MRKILNVLLSILLVVGLVGCGYALLNSSSNDTAVIDSENSVEESLGTEDTENNENSGGEEEGSSEENVPTEPEKPKELKGLKIPDNQPQLIADGLQMHVGAQLALTDERALRFTCNISSELYDEVQANPNKSLGMLVIAQTFFDRVNTESYTYIDWISAFDEAGVTNYNYLEYSEEMIAKTDDGYYMRYKLYGIAYAGINHPITCIGVLGTKNADGRVTYQYAAMPSGETYQSNSRSMAYVAAASLNANVLGLESFTSEEVALIKGYINDSVDKANGLSTPTNDGSMYAFTTNITTPQTLSVGQSFTITTTILPDVKVPIWYRSSDTSVIEVDENGKVTAKAKGTAIVGVYVAGEVCGITVKVE